MRRAICAVTSWAGRFGSGHRGGVSCTTRPPSRSIKDRRIRLIEEFCNSTALGHQWSRFDADRKLRAARIPPSACLSSP